MVNAARQIRAFFEADRRSAAAVYLFGSLARGEGRADSDVDVAVLFDAPPSRTLQGQPFDVEDALERALGRHVDLVTLNTAPVDLRIRVLREGRLLIENDPPARVRFEIATRNEAFDLEPVLRAYRAPRAVK